MKEYKWTIIGLISAFALWALTVSLHLDLFESFIACLKNNEHIEVDEIVFPAAVFYVFIMIDLSRNRQRSRVEVEKHKVYRSMLKAMDHILNNFLQKMLLFKMAAEETDGFNPDVLKKYDIIINEATAQINALEGITNPDAENILTTIGHQF
jgi:hypothetical protein